MTQPAALLDDQVHVLQCRLDATPAAAAMHCLSPDETARAARWHRSRDRDRYVASRVWLRRILASYLGTAPELLAFDLGGHGKPTLRAPHQTLQFNLSHSGAVALLAVSRAGAVGTDIEALLPMDDMAAIARRHFAPREWYRWWQLPEAERVRAFYACWTRKEAYVKALGSGLSARLDGFEVEFEPSRSPALLSVGGSAAAAAAWSVWSLEPPAHIAAVVVQGTGLRLLTIGEG